MNTYVVGDVHGRFDLLCQALSLAERDAGPEGGTFICLGDFIDRGPQSRSIVDLLMVGPRLPNWTWIVLQGNHEEMMVATMDAPGLFRHWARNGGFQTLASYGYENGDSLLPWKVPQAHVDWMKLLPVTHEDKHRIFVHAGVPYDVPLPEADQQHLQWMLYRDPGDETYYADAHYFDDRPHVSGKHIVHGHHQSACHPLLKPHRTNLDSFAYHTGRLAIGVFDDTQGEPIRVLEAVGPRG